jgi:hypothetical protein
MISPLPTMEAELGLKLFPPAMAVGSLLDQVPPAGVALRGISVAVSHKRLGVSGVRLILGKGLIRKVVSLKVGQPVAVWVYRILQELGVVDELGSGTLLKVLIELLDIPPRSLVSL